MRALLKVKVSPSPPHLCAPADQHEAPEHTLRAPRADKMVTMAQAQVQAEHSFAKGRSGGLAVCGLSSFCLLLTGRLADPGVGAVFVSLSACLLIPAQALAGLKLAQGKMRHKIHPALCAFHITRDCSGWGRGQPCRMWTAGSEGGTEMGGKTAGRNCMGRPVGEHPPLPGGSRRRKLCR